MFELKSCPFCGGKAILERKEDFRGKPIYQVYCPSTLVRVGTTWFPTEREAVEAWNRRADG